MEILKQGQIIEKKFERSCYKCRTKFAYTIKDVESDRDGSYVKCPTCESFLAHPPTK